MQETDPLAGFNGPKLLNAALGRVKGYRRNKFPELTQEERDKLKKAILDLEGAAIDYLDIVIAHGGKTDSF